MAANEKQKKNLRYRCCGNACDNFNLCCFRKVTSIQKSIRMYQRRALQRGVDFLIRNWDHFPQKFRFNKFLIFDLGQRQK